MVYTGLHTLNTECLYAAEKLLGESERLRLGGLKAGRRQEFLVSRFMLRHLLSQMTGYDILPAAWSVQERADLPPKIQQLKNLGLCFSISHSHGMVAVVVGRGSGIGLDIEKHRERNHLALAEQWFSGADYSMLQCLPQALRGRGFYKLWTAKEAYIKLHQKSVFDTELKQLRIRPSRPLERAAEYECYLLLAQTGDYSFALAAASPISVKLVKGAPELVFEHYLGACESD